MQPPNSRSLKKNGDIWKAKVLPVTLTWSQHGTGRPAELGSLTKQGKALWATQGTSCCCWTPGEEHEPEAVCSCCCPRSKRAFSLGKARYTGCSEPDSTLGWHLVSLAQYTTFSLPIHPVLIISLWLLNRLQGYNLGWAEILEKGILILISLTTILEPLLALYVYPQLPS